MAKRLTANVKTGLQVLAENGFRELSGKRIGLITNHTGVDERLVSTAEVLARQPGLQLVALFGPEHGIGGDVADAEAVASGRDAVTGLPVYSLYGDDLAPRAEWLTGLDALVFDNQDIGSRFYTYIWTLAGCMAVAGRAGIEIIVLDRPNPIGGLAVEGTILEPEFASFVGLHPLATRHGLTVGEFARMCVRAGWVRPAPPLTVIEMAGWRRAYYFEDTGLAWVPTSPAATTVDMAVIYPGTCLFEGTNVSEGRGSNLPFEVIGAPWVNGWHLRDEIGDIAGARLRPLYFRPTWSKYAGEVCGGVQIHVTDRSAFRPVETGLRLVETLLRMYPERLGFATGAGPYHFDRLAGSDRVRKGLLAGRGARDILQDFEPQLDEYRRLREQILIYHD
ncbi:MAG: exo-beta-N-acetylmuramidase NamZ domain-containing protein [Chloroflexota bacterium]